MTAPPEWLAGKAIRLGVDDEVVVTQRGIAAARKKDWIILSEKSLWLVADDGAADALISGLAAEGRECRRGQVMTWSEMLEITKLGKAAAREAMAWKGTMNAAIASARRLDQSP